MSRYALAGGSSGELLTFRGKTIVHSNKAEMEFLFPRTRIVRVTDGDSLGPVIALKDHPGMKAVRFPLRREDFNA